MELNKNIISKYLNVQINDISKIRPNLIKLDKWNFIYVNFSNNYYKKK